METDTEDNFRTLYNFENMPLDMLCDHIEQTHHKYVERKSVEIKNNLNTLIEQFQNEYPELVEVKYIFDDTASQLAMHMRREELMLFPVIRKMTRTNQPVKTMFGSIRNPIETMLNEHESEEKRFETIAKLTNNYQSGDEKNKLLQETLYSLKEFGIDLRQHIHLENDILFPKSIELEDKLNI